MMLTYQGKGVYGAVAIGKISVFKRQDVQVRREKIEDTEGELKRLEAAKAAAIEQLRQLKRNVLKSRRKKSCCKSSRARKISLLMAERSTSMPISEVLTILVQCF